jgi:hypothetical protein
MTNTQNQTDKLGKNGRPYLSKSTLLNNSNNVFIAVHVNGNQIAYQYYGDTGLGKRTCLFGSEYINISDALKELVKLEMRADLIKQVNKFLHFSNLEEVSK